MARKMSSDPADQRSPFAPSSGRATGADETVAALKLELDVTQATTAPARTSKKRWTTESALRRCLSGKRNCWKWWPAAGR